MLAVVIGACIVVAAAVVYAVAATSPGGGTSRAGGSGAGATTPGQLPSDFDPPPSNDVPDASQPVNHGPDKQAPTVPGNFDTKAQDRVICLSWDAATDNVSVVGYRLFRDGEQIPVNHGSGACGSGYEDRVGCVQKTYTYEVIAYDAAGNASKPAQAEGGPPFCSI
jgi:hypothetical protein